MNLRDSSGLVADLSDRLSGPAFLPGEPGYSEECGTYNLMTPLRPRVAVGAETVGDVQAAVRFAAEHGLGVAVRGGGHIVANFKYVPPPFLSPAELDKALCVFR